MSKRVRLTQRRGRQAVDGSIPYPGNVNQPDRQFKEWDQYHTFEQRVNHELPDMRHDWKNDERDEIGFGIPEPWGESPTVASVKVAANKAVKLAYLLLGEKVEEGVIEAQANDLMLLGPEALDRSLARFAQTQELYAADDEGDDDEGDEDADDAEATTASEAADDDEGEEGDDDADDAEATTASEALAEEAAEDDDAEDSGSDDQKVAAEVTAEEHSDDGDDGDDSDDGDDGDSDDGDEGDSKEASQRTGMNEMDIELSSAVDGMSEGEADTRLASLFGDDIPEELPEPGTGRREASEKRGVKSLGGQPRVASSDSGAADISSIWGDAPDVSEIFR